MDKTVLRDPDQSPGNEPDPMHPPGSPERPPMPSPERPETPRIRPDIDPDIPEHPGPPLSDPENPRGYSTVSE